MLALACLCGLSLYFNPASSEARPSPQASRALASFPHDAKGHKTLDCAKCHTISPAQVDVRRFPGHLACTPCHNFAAEFFIKPNGFCGVCHEGRPVSRSQAALFGFPKSKVKTDFGMDFSHPSHLKPLPDGNRPAVMRAAGLSAGESNRCAACHKAVEQAPAGARELTIETGHAACFKCHDEKPLAAPAMFDCARCHRLGYPRAPRLFGIVREFRHADHDYDIRPKKKSEFQAVKAGDVLCSECHRAVTKAARLDEIKLPEPGYCRQCHNGKTGLPEALPQSLLDSLANR
jgi:hypothetical protein